MNANVGLQYIVISLVYHCACIDPWLTKSKRSCPICKRKVIPGDDPDSDESESDDEADTASERTPLLGGGQSGNNNNNRRSTFDNSGRLAKVNYFLACSDIFVC